MGFGSQQVLLTHGYMLDRNNSPVPKPDRPSTIADARKQIADTFAHQGSDGEGWTTDQQATYLARRGIKAGKVEDLTHDEVRRVLNEMEKSRMILFRD